MGKINITEQSALLHQVIVKTYLIHKFVKCVKLLVFMRPLCAHLPIFRGLLITDHVSIWSREANETRVLLNEMGPSEISKHQHFLKTSTKHQWFLIQCPQNIHSKNWGNFKIVIEQNERRAVCYLDSHGSYQSIFSFLLRSILMEHGSIETNGHLNIIADGNHKDISFYFYLGTEAISSSIC